MTTPTNPTTTYRIGVTVAHTWATGTIKSTSIKYVDVEEASTILGGMRAVDAAVAKLEAERWLVMSDYSPTLDPNPAELGWPIGLPEDSCG